MTKLPEAGRAARRLAQLVVQRHDLVPPVDIHTLLAGYADVAEVAWRQDIDALVYRSGPDRPRVLLRHNVHWRRRRFTAAHELGHVLIPWHSGDLTCAPHYEMSELAFVGAEDEADIFASGVLVPDRWLAALLIRHEEDMNRILEELRTAEVSALAAVLALRRVLFAGWGFVLKVESVPYIFVTPGTRLEAKGGDRSAELAHVALDRGQVEVQGKGVEWFRLRPLANMPADIEPKARATSHLTAALAEYAGSAEERGALQLVLNGKVGGILREAGGRPAAELFATLEYRLALDGYDALLALPDFRRWLAIKAVAKERAGPNPWSHGLDGST